jgi:hypothetical protein
MRKTLVTFTLLTLAVTTSLFAVDTKHQSYISYDDGGTVIRGGDDERDVEARVNMPVYPGDELTTNRRGRVEIRLSDGNVVGVDRATAILFRSILDSYEGESSTTVADLRYGKVIVYRTDRADEALRLDTEYASYVASREAVYSVEKDTSGKDRVSVFDGSIEVRTRSRSTRLRAGEELQVDQNGPYQFSDSGSTSTDDFERWFLKRFERYDRSTSRYLDKNASYYEDELSSQGKWVMVTGLGWSWRPYVSAGWRPYYNGYWSHGRAGCLTWVSYEPWGWYPYHYGRWAYDNGFGWVWLPGGGYSPAWVYWWYGNGYVGWAPSGWWEGHRPYYNWAYQPYQRVGVSAGFGFYGRVRVNDVDLRPWTFVDSNTIVSHRVDRAALTTDAIRARLLRDGDGFGTVSSAPARFTRQEFKDPAAAINRRIAGSGTGKEGPGSPADVTPFIRRDPELQSGIRDRIIRSTNAGSTTPTRGGGSIAPIGSGNVAPIGGGNVAPIGRGNVAPIGGGNVAPTTDAGRINRGGTTTGTTGGTDWRNTDTGRIGRGTTVPPVVERDGSRIGREGIRDGGAVQPTDRDSSSTGSGSITRSRTPVTAEPDANVDRSQGSAVPPGTTKAESWRGRTRSSDSSTAEPSTRSGSTPSTSSGSDVPRRVIDRIGGARISDDSRESTGSSTGSRSRSSRSGATSTSEPSKTRDSGSSSTSAPRSSSPPPSSSPAPSTTSSQRDGASENRSDGGKIRRDDD